jgi:flagellar basal body-associated protein FliL
MLTRHRSLWIFLLVLLALLAWGVSSAHAADPTPFSAGAGSPISDFTVNVIIYTMLGTLLVVALLGGAFLVLNLGLLSKREEDRIGGRTPSDVGILKDNIWPEEPRNVPRLPAEEDEADIPPGKRVA